MPSFHEINNYAVKIADYLDSKCSPQEFFKVVEWSFNHPEQWGMPRNFSQRPNWELSTWGPAIARVLWGKVTHPANIPWRWKGLPTHMAIRLYWGKTPLQVWSWDETQRPSRKIAAEWIAAIATNRRVGGTEWRLWSSYGWSWFLARNGAKRGDYIPRTKLIAEWLVNKRTWRGWRQEIEIGYGPDGEMIKISPEAMLDEVEDRDLVQGAKTNPETVFRRVLARTSEAVIAKLVSDTKPFPKMPWKPIQGIKQILTPKELVLASKKFKNCSAGYVDRCRREECYLLELKGSMAEILPDGTVYQHRGYCNHMAPSEDQAIISRWIVERRK